MQIQEGLSLLLVNVESFWEKKGDSNAYSHVVFGHNTNQQQVFKVLIIGVSELAFSSRFLYVHTKT
jgi:hypothetical protein